MRPRAIQTVPGLDPNASPFERLKEFARMIIRVPKEEAEKEKRESDLTTPIRSRGRNGPNGRSKS